jgi:Fic family protein
MFPLLPSKMTNLLSGLIDKIETEVQSLGEGINPFVLESVEHFMLPINSYYTNAMEGNPSRLRDIENASKKLSRDKQMRNYQLEHLAHIEVQKMMIKRITDEPKLEITSADFLCWMHSEFYKRLPESMRYAKTISGKTLPVCPGQLRDIPAEVGKHQPPNGRKDVSRALQQFSQALSPQNVSGKMKFLSFAGSHHRLLWIHPFRDGNGRVARLFSIAYQNRIGIAGHNLWTVTRAFARQREDYDRHLALADQTRRNDLDGRGPLSEEGFLVFCEYFLGQCLDQIRYMKGLLNFTDMEKRFMRDVKLGREEKIFSKSAAEVMEFMFYKGEIARGEVQKICKVQRRRASDIINELIRQDRIVSLSPRRGKLRLKFTSDSAKNIFPDLI